MSRRDDKYGQEEEAKPTRPRRLRREDEELGGNGSDYKESTLNDKPSRDSKVSSPQRESAPSDEPAPKPRRRRDPQADGGGWMTTASGGAKPLITTTPAADDRNIDEDIPDVAIASSNHNKHFDVNKDEGGDDLSLICMNFGVLTCHAVSVEIVMIPDLEDDGGGDGDGRG